MYRGSHRWTTGEPLLLQQHCTVFTFLRSFSYLFRHSFFVIHIQYLIWARPLNAHSYTKIGKIQLLFLRLLAGCTHVFKDSTIYWGFCFPLFFENNFYHFLTSKQMFLLWNNHLHTYFSAKRLVLPLILKFENRFFCLFLWFRGSFLKYFCFVC